MGLGPTHTFTLAEARDRATDCRKKLFLGIDPINARKSAEAQARLEAASTMTFRQCAEAFIAAHRPSWKNAKHALQWPASLEAYAYPTMGNLSVQIVDV